MSWRRGELWLDSDLLWFREGMRGPVLAGFAPAALPGFGPPPGLAASRQRRAEWHRRRKTRKLRTAALVLTPAVVLPVAVLRSNGGSSSLAVDDPPSLTIRLGSGDLGRPPGAIARKLRTDSLGIAPPRETAEARRSLRHAEIFPAVVWHHSTSVGLPWAGHLIEGTQLPIDGPSWVTWDPVTDSVPNQPHRLYGNEHTIRTVISVLDAYHAAHPDAPRVVVGDVSLEGGGPMSDEHVSHQNGLDVDIYYPRLDRALASPTSPDQIDHRLAQDLVDRFVAAGAQLIFVGYSTGLQGPSGVVIPYPNHDNHMHVRFPPPG